MGRILVLVTLFFGSVFLLLHERLEERTADILDSEVLWELHLENIRGQLLKTDQPDEFAKYHWMIRTRSGSKGPTYAPNYKLEQLKVAQRNRQVFAQARRQELNFVERGPGNVPGRTRALVVLPGDPSGNSWIAGAVGGGLWRTTNAGASWTNLTPDLPNLAVSTLVISNSDPNIMYVGTGESFAGISGVRGDGIFKSIDGGITWVQLASTVSNDDFQNVNRIIVHPTDPDIVLSCTSNDPNFSSFDSGIFKSTDGGSNWTRVFDRKS